MSGRVVHVLPQCVLRDSQHAVSDNDWVCLVHAVGVSGVDRGVLEDNPGSSEVRVKLQEPGRTTLMQLDKRLAVTPSAALYASLKALLGPGCLS